MTFSNDTIANKENCQKESRLVEEKDQVNMTENCRHRYKS